MQNTVAPYLIAKFFKNTDELDNLDCQLIFFTINMIFSINKGYCYAENFAMDNMIGCDGICSHPMNWCSRKFDLQIGSRQRVHKETKWS